MKHVLKKVIFAFCNLQQQCAIVAMRICRVCYQFSIRSGIYKKQISVAFIKWLTKNSYNSKVKFGRNVIEVG